MLKERSKSSKYIIESKDSQVLHLEAHGTTSSFATTKISAHVKIRKVILLLRIHFSTNPGKLTMPDNLKCVLSRT